MTEEIVLFYGHRKSRKVTNSCFSQFYQCEFIVDGQRYNCAEQFMMAEKARAFGDEKTLEKILAAKSPANIKALGRRVRPFDAKMWATIAENVVLVGNFAKFAQNKELKDHLMATGDAILAEASPTDRIWGIGLAKSDARASNHKSWKGKNLLGFALMSVREALWRNDDEARFRADHPIQHVGTDVLAMLNNAIAAEKEARRRTAAAQREAYRKTPEYKERKAVAVAYAAAKSVKGPKKSLGRMADATLDLSARTEVTNRNFIQKVQAAVIPSVNLVDGMSTPNALEASFTDEQQTAKVQFDKIYRPFVYKVLLASPEKDGLGFAYKMVYDTKTCRYKVPYRGEISGEVVYSEVWMRLFGTDGNKPALLNFDATQKNVGCGAFRLYLRLIVKSVYYDLVRKDTMILKDVHGKTIYKTDPHTNKYLLNAKGEKIPVRVPRSATSDENVIANALSGAYSANRSKRVERTIFQRRISLKYLAYLHVHETKISKGGWFYRASAEMFESGIPADDVLAKCLERGDIKQRESFDTALSRFRAAIDKKASELSKAIFSSEESKITSEGELLDHEWETTAKTFGMSRVRDVRLRVMAAMMDAFESGRR